MNFYPFNWILLANIVSTCFWVETCSSVNFSYFGFAGCWSFLNAFVAIHTNVYRWNTRVTRFFNRVVAILTSNSIITGMYFMREFNWLFWMIPFVRFPIVINTYTE